MEDKIIIDSRALEEGHKYRGIGVVASQLLLTLPRNKKRIFYILLNSKEFFDGLKLPENCRFLRYRSKNFYRLKWLLERSYLNSFVSQDSVYFNSYLDYPSGNKRSVVYCHDVAPLVYRRHYKFIDVFKFKFKFKKLPQAARVLTLSEFSKKEICRYLPELEPKIRVVYAALNPGFRIFSSEELEVVRRKWEQKLGDSFFIFPASFTTADYRKNYDFAVNFWREVVKRHPESKLVLVGKKGNLAEELKQKISALGLSAHIVFTDYVSQKDLVGLYNLSRGLFFPTMYEGFGLPVLEALACGKPLIATDTASIPEVAGRAGILIKPDFNNYKPWLDSVSIILEGKYKVPLGEAAKQVRKYSLESLAARLNKVLEEFDEAVN